jgi:hypothetical protein
MANSHSLFSTYNGELQINKSKRQKLMKSKDALMEKIKKHFKENHPDYVPHFYIQGSYKTATMIRTKDDTCDLDLGIIFECEPDVTPTTLQKWVKEAVDGHTETPPEHRSKCIRVIYAGDYHIDLPVFYEIEEDKHPHLAVKNEGWQDDDPKEFTKWYLDIKDEKGQLQRTVRYLKGWSDHKSKKLPSGLELTILAAKYIRYHKRDDIALRNTLENMQTGLGSKFSCKMPTTPKEDLFDKYSENREQNFLDALDSFVIDANKAIDEKNLLKSSKKWQKHLGEYFPDGEDKNDPDIGKSDSLQKAAKGIGTGGVKVDQQGRISKDGTESKPHRNYGEPK